MDLHASEDKQVFPALSKYVDVFIGRWSAFGAAERVSLQTFLTDLRKLLGAEKPRSSIETEEKIKIEASGRTFISNWAGAG